MKIRRLAAEQLVEWVDIDISKSSFAHYDHKDWRCHCWVCDGVFVDADMKTVVGTSDGPKLIHTTCYNLQTRNTV